MMLKKKLSLAAALLLSLASSHSFAQDEATKKENRREKPRASSTRPLFFPANSNGLQVLPQKFEYTLLNDHTLRIGDILVNTNEMSFDILNGKNGKELRFQWPAGLLSSGTIVLKNNNGKAIYTKEFSKENTTSVKSSINLSEEESNEKYRTDILQLVGNPEEPEIFDDMKYFPFMSFCVFKDDEDTRISLCSNELYLGTTEDGRPIVKSRGSTKKSVFVDINGKLVGNQGLIFLNDRTENIDFRTQMQSGATLEISTRMKDVDFKDVVADPDGKRLLLTAAGAEPINEEQVTRLPNGDWKVFLSKARPYFWLKGEGGIPMRQEFFVRSEVPTENDRAYISARTQDKIYGSNIRVAGISRNGVIVESFDDFSKIEPNKKPQQFEWSILELTPRQVNRRFLKIKSREKNFVAAMDFTRGTPYRLQLTLTPQFPAANVATELAGQMWFDRFLGMDSAWAKFRWGTDLSYSTLASKKSDQVKVDSFAAKILYRLTPGLQFDQGTEGLALQFRSNTWGTSSGSLLGISVFSQRPSPRWLLSVSDWYEAHAGFSTGSGTGDLKVNGVVETHADFIKALKDSLRMTYGLGYTSTSSSPQAKELSNATLRFGLQYLF